MSDELTVGGDVDAWCTRCNMELAHTIVAMVAGSPVQVKCNTCGGFHKFRLPPGQKAALAKAKKAKAKASKGTSKAKAEKKPKTTSWETDWRAQMDQSAELPVRPYRMTETFAQSEVVQHARFGVGVVQQVVGPQRVIILFRDGLRTLIMGR